MYSCSSLPLGSVLLRLSSVSIALDFIGYADGTVARGRGTPEPHASSRDLDTGGAARPFASISTNGTRSEEAVWLKACCSARGGEPFVIAHEVRVCVCVSTLFLSD